jgi:hypothetical protein
MLPDTEALCSPFSAHALCDPGSWHVAFLVQSLLVVSLGLVNVGTGLRHALGWRLTPLPIARGLAWGTLAASGVPALTGLWLWEKVRAASLACYLRHGDSGCTHTLLDRAREMAGVAQWVGWTESLLVGTCVVALGMLYARRR